MFDVKNEHKCQALLTKLAAGQSLLLQPMNDDGQKKRGLMGHASQQWMGDNIGIIWLPKKKFQNSIGKSFLSNMKFVKLI